MEVTITEFNEKAAWWAGCGALLGGADTIVDEVHFLEAATTLSIRDRAAKGVVRPDARRGIPRAKDRSRSREPIGCVWWFDR